MTRYKVEAVVFVYAESEREALERAASVVLFSQLAGVRVEGAPSGKVTVVETQREGRYAS